MSSRILALLAALMVLVGIAATPASPAPKLKSPGDILVDYVAGKDPGTDGLVAQWHTGLNFRNAPQVHSAVCVYDPQHDDWHVAGLHFTTAAADQLASNLVHMAGGHSSGGIEIVNHRNGRRNIWVTVNPRDAKTLSSQITTAARGHAQP